MAPEEARYAAVRKFGNVMRVKERPREVWSFVWLEQLRRNFSLGCGCCASLRVCGGGDSYAGVGNCSEYRYFQLDRCSTAAVAAGGESLAVGAA